MIGRRAQRRRPTCSRSRAYGAPAAAWTTLGTELLGDGRRSRRSSPPAAGSALPAARRAAVPGGRRVTGARGLAGPVGAARGRARGRRDRLPAAACSRRRRQPAELPGAADASGGGRRMTGGGAVRSRWCCRRTTASRRCGATSARCSQLRRRRPRSWSSSTARPTGLRSGCGRSDDPRVQDDPAGPARITGRAQPGIAAARGDVDPDDRGRLPPAARFRCDAARGRPRARCADRQRAVARVGGSRADRARRSSAAGARPGPAIGLGTHPSVFPPVTCRPRFSTGSSSRDARC